MGLQKIPKGKWMKLSEDEKRFYELEYKKAFERNKRFTIVSTRVIALICIFVLFFIGVAMQQQVNEYGKIKDQYGDQAFCYLCGLETKKSCECVYYSKGYKTDQFKLTEEYTQQLAEDNAQECRRDIIVGSQGDVYQNDFDFSNLTISG